MIIGNQDLVKIIQDKEELLFGLRKYEEEKSMAGLFGSPNVYYGGYISGVNLYSVPEQDPIQIEGKYYKEVANAI